MKILTPINRDPFTFEEIRKFIEMKKRHERELSECYTDLKISSIFETSTDEKLKNFNFDSSIPSFEDVSAVNSSILDVSPVNSIILDVSAVNNSILDSPSSDWLYLIYTFLKFACS